jgi:hypothetical protein
MNPTLPATVLGAHLDSVRRLLDEWQMLRATSGTYCGAYRFQPSGTMSGARRPRGVEIHPLASV